MIPVLSAAQIREVDAYTIANEPIASIDLMERASLAFAKQFLRLLPSGKVIHVFAGTGNNGGDGLAVARILHEKGLRIHTYIVGNAEKGSPDFRTNYDRLSGRITAVEIESRDQIPSIGKDVIIDALFGSGLSRPVGGLYADVVQTLNQSEAMVVALDMPSGLYADRVSEGAIVEADHTISFQVPKLAFFHPGSASYVGQWHLVDIGLNKAFIQSQQVGHYYTETGDITLPRRSHFAHKGEAGRLLLVAGSKGKIGAATLSARAALRSGCGLLFIHAPACGTSILQINVPEAMILEDAHSEVITEVKPDAKIGTIAAGPGIGTNRLTRDALTQLIKKTTIPLVLDADAINMVADEPQLLEALPEGTVLTPHPGEFGRLVGSWENDFHKLELLRGFCKKHNVHVVLKGAFSAVCDSDGLIYFNSSGNPGMATGGSGDVLTGMISAFMVQGITPFAALKSAVYVHGVAADCAREGIGVVPMIASDIVAHIPAAFKKLSG